MKEFKCKNCTSTSLTFKDGFWICDYCGSKFKPEENETISKSSSIGVVNDVERLLRKCEEEPWQAKKYANLILDIDPNNKEALKYI